MSNITAILRNDPNNIGDYFSAPSRHFNFGQHLVHYSDIQDISESRQYDDKPSPTIIGGGGLLVDYYLDAIDRIRTTSKRKRVPIIAWGVGQQLHTVGKSPWWNQWQKFDYQKYLDGFDLVGIRDWGLGLPWVPCASCMHPAFDTHRAIEHEFVIFSHKWYPIPVTGYPHMNNNTNDFEATLNFLASGETILTSSFHGMYWGTLLNRKVIAFPSNSKFFTHRYPASIYPAVWHQPRTISEKIRFLKKLPEQRYICPDISGWRIQAGSSRNYPEALDECRAQNLSFYEKVMNIL